MHPEAIGPFKIERELGRGGMGVVYLATDTSLDRQVAIKALPADLAADADRLARFQREAKVLASLNHPNVAGIYGLESADGQQYLVLEFIEGETLADRLVGGAIPVEEALTLARQIAEALEAAHEKGVIHRDLKPANVMVTAEGVVKVLDFGLARTADGSPSAMSVPARPDSPTMPSPVRHSPTIPGAIMGTAGYMSPEQARGKPVDKRSDIFSFGCVHYEMLTGVMPFRGETVADSLGATLHKESDLSLLPANTPRRVREMLTSCLVKDRRNRLHDIGDARLELERAISGREWASAAGGDRAMGGAPLRWVAGAVAVAGLLGAGWLLGGSWQRHDPGASGQAYHLSATVPAKPEINAVIGISPEARFVVYRASPRLPADSIAPEGVLVVRRLDRDETKVIEGTEGAMGAALSSDGRWIAFVAARDRVQSKISLKKIALDDGRPVGVAESLCELPTSAYYTLCWSSDREIVLNAGWQSTLLAVSAAGGEPRVVLKEERAKEIDNWGSLRPLEPGRSILASRWALVGESIKERLEVVDLATGTRTPLLQNAGTAQLVAGGYLVSNRNLNTLIAARIDTSVPRIVGEPVTIWSGGTVMGEFFISAGGTLAMMSTASDYSARRLVWIDEHAQPQPVGAPPRAYGSIQVSPDGGRVLTVLESAVNGELPTELWIQDLSRRTFSKISTQAPSFEFIWSNDGQRIAYTSVTPQEFSIWERRADGSGEAVKVYASGSAQTMLAPTAWSPDGKTLAVLKQDLTGQAEDVLMLEKEAGTGTWKATPYLNSPASEHALRFSPDGKWVMFCSAESGRHELYVQPFTGAGSGAADSASGRVQISTNGHDGSGWWSPDGKELRYVDSDTQVMSVEVRNEPRFSVSLPKLLYSIKELKTRARAWSPDGRLMAVVEGENERPNKIDLVVNFGEELRAKLAQEK